MNINEMRNHLIDIISTTLLSTPYSIVEFTNVVVDNAYVVESTKRITDIYRYHIDKVVEIENISIDLDGWNNKLPLLGQSECIIRKLYEFIKGENTTDYINRIIHEDFNKDIKRMKAENEYNFSEENLDYKVECINKYYKDR